MLVNAPELPSSSFPGKSTGTQFEFMIWTMALEKRSVGRPHLDVRGDNILSQATG